MSRDQHGGLARWTGDIERTLMKVSFICPIRDKASHVEKAVRSIFNQTYSPMEIVLSDQGSVDGSLEIIQRLALSYNGPNKVRVLNCEDTSYRGMVGLNKHLNFINEHIEGDIVMNCSADDINHPDRALHTVRAFEDFNPSYVNTGCRYMDKDGNLTGTTDFIDRRSRWVKPAETIIQQIGSCGTSAWARDLYQIHGPLEGCEQQDMILPMMALYERGIYYVDRVLYTYIAHASTANAGVTGQISAAMNGNHHNQLVEINNFIHVHNWTRTVGRWQDSGKIEQLLADPEAASAVGEKISQSALGWAQIRNDLIVNRCPPRHMNV
jgi:glycosyltransferase involved in cell wall biosynthesis